MRMKMSKQLINNTINYIILFLLLISFQGKAQPAQNDTIPDSPDTEKKYEQFYDSLEYKAKQSKLISLIYDFLVSPPRPYVDKEALALEYYSKFEGKLISDITITPLEVFGPTFEDTTRTAKSFIEKTANALHSKSNLNTIE